MKVKLQYIAEFQAEIPASSEEEARQILKTKIDSLIHKKDNVYKELFTFCSAYTYKLLNKVSR